MLYTRFLTLKYFWMTPFSWKRGPNNTEEDADDALLRFDKSRITRLGIFQRVS